MFTSAAVLANPRIEGTSLLRRSAPHAQRWALHDEGCT